MKKGYVTGEEFKGYILNLIKMLEDGTSREEAIAYLNNVIYERCGHDREDDASKQGSSSQPALEQIQAYLNEYGFENELRFDRKAGPYINLGDVARRKRRAQFWYGEKKKRIILWIGKEMGLWYSISSECEFLKRNHPTEGIENKLEFSDMTSVQEFICAVTLAFA